MSELTTIRWRHVTDFDGIHYSGGWWQEAYTLSPIMLPLFEVEVDELADADKATTRTLGRWERKHQVRLECSPEVAESLAELPLADEVQIQRAGEVLAGTVADFESEAVDDHFYIVTVTLLSKALVKRISDINLT